MLKIFYNGTEWRVFEAPEKLRTKITDGRASYVSDEKYQQALSKAAKTSLKVLNPEIINEDTFDYDVYKIVNDIADQQYYDWPGSYEKLTDKDSSGKASGEEVYVLTPPANSAHGFTEGSEVHPPASVEKEEKIYVDGDFNNSYEARVKNATGKNTIISKEELQSLRSKLKAAYNRIKELEEKIEHLEYGGENI